MFLYRELDFNWTFWIWLISVLSTWFNLISEIINITRFELVIWTDNLLQYFEFRMIVYLHNQSLLFLGIDINCRSYLFMIESRMLRCASSNLFGMYFSLKWIPSRNPYWALTEYKPIKMMITIWNVKKSLINQNWLLRLWNA